MADNNNNNRRRPQHEQQLMSEYGKLQPQDLKIEEAVLGAIMLEKEAYTSVSDILKPESFYDTAHQHIYEAIVALGAKQRPVDMLTVTEQLRNDGNLEAVGGAARITQLTGMVSSAANIEFHARIIAQKYIARRLINFSSTIQEKAFDETNDVYDLMQEAEGALFDISKNTLKRDVQQIDPIIGEAIKKIQEAANNKSGVSGLNTGFQKLDRLTSGWQNSDLIIIAARPAMGKTAFVLSMAKNMAVDYNIPVAIFSLEMSNLQLVNRLISNVCELEGEKIKNGQLSNEDWEKLMARSKKLYSAPLYVDDTPSLSVFEFQTKARRLKSEHDIKIIIIDYLQLMNASGMKFGSREQEVSNISRSLKALAKDLNIPIIALSQLNRSVEQRGDDKRGKRPQLSDLRESGAIEQDADIVCFIHREEYYTKSSEDAEGNDIRGKAEFIIAKHRSGAVDDVPMRFVHRFARFEDWDSNYNLTGQNVVQSKMNATSDDPIQPAAPLANLEAGTPPPVNEDFLSSGPDEIAPPF